MIALVLAIRMLSSPSSAAAASELNSLTMAARVATMPLQSVQMLSAEPGSAHGPRWLVWSVGRGNYVPGWSRQGRPVLLLTVDDGARAEETEIIALDCRGLPDVLDHRRASHAALLPDGLRLELDQAPGSVPAGSCLT